MFVGTGEIDTQQMYSVTNPSHHSSQLGIYTNGSHEGALPLAVVTASSQCACSANECVVGLKFFL